MSSHRIAAMSHQRFSARAQREVELELSEAASRRRDVSADAQRAADDATALVGELQLRDLALLRGLHRPPRACLGLVVPLCALLNDTAPQQEERVAWVELKEVRQQQGIG